jgi:gliding motility-associated-like protein
VNPDCAGRPIIFTDNSTPSGLNYNWDFGNGNTSSVANPVVTFSQGGNFTVTLIVSNGGCADTATQVLQIYTQPVAAFTANPLRVVQNEEAVVFTNISTGADTYFWNFGDGQNSNDFEPAHTYNQIGFYTVSLIAANQQGCSDTISRTAYIEVYDKPILFIPNAFSPNGDGVNDVFFVSGSGFKEFYLAIFNRWGEKVFEAEDQRSGWNGTHNGKEMEQAVYVYYVKAAFSDLTVKTFKGSLMLIR